MTILTDFNNIQNLDKPLTILFNKIYNTLSVKYGCTYLSYVLESESTNQKITLTSNPLWGKHFYEKGLIKKCHFAETLRAMRLITPSFTMCWTDIHPNTRNARRIHLLRRDFNLDNGISYATLLPRNKLNYYYELINIGGDILDINFYREIQQNKIFVITLLFEIRKKALPLLDKINVNG